METHNQTIKVSTSQRVKSWAIEVLILPIRIYQWLISPWLGPHCRFQPSCSHFAIDAIREHGPLIGSAMAFRRIAKCHPWHPGGLDPVPRKSTSNKNNGS